MDYRFLERAFIERTIEIIDQYEKWAQPNLLPDGQYEVTLLINCLLGLLVFPQQLAHRENWNTWLTEDTLVEVGPEWNISLTDIIGAGCKSEKDQNGRYIPIAIEQLTVRQLIRQMRNSVAHSNFQVESSSSTRKIESVVFRSDCDFHMILQVQRLEKFVRKLARSALEKLPAAPAS